MILEGKSELRYRLLSKLADQSLIKTEYQV